MKLKPGFHMIVRIVPIVPVVSKNVQAIGTIIWKHFPDDRRRSQTTRTIGTITIVRIELCSIRTIAHDRGDREKSEAIKWKHSQTIGTIGTIEVYPRKHHSRHHFSRFRAKIALEFANFLLSFDRSAESKICAFVVLFYLFYGAKLKE